MKDGLKKDKTKGRDQFGSCFKRLCKRRLEPVLGYSKRDGKDFLAYKYVFFSTVNQ